MLPRNLWANAMSELLALSVSVAVLGGIWAFIALGPLASLALVWVGFIGAGCFFAAGGDTKALTKTIVGMIYGAIVAWIALLIIAKVPVPSLGTVWPAIVVGVTVFFLVIVASADLLSSVPANVYGYAALVGYTLSAGKLDALTAADNSNPLFLIAVSAILGGVLGYLNGAIGRCAETQGGQIAADQLHIRSAPIFSGGSVQPFCAPGSRRERRKICLRRREAAGGHCSPDCSPNCHPIVRQLGCGHSWRKLPFPVPAWAPWPRLRRAIAAVIAAGGVISASLVVQVLE